MLVSMLASVIELLTLIRQFGDDPSSFPLLVPIMIGNTDNATERKLGELLAPYLVDPSTTFVISSDFAHWGLRFRYTFYRSHRDNEGSMLDASAKPKNRAIHESIKEVDFQSIEACESGSHEAWLDALDGKTVPITAPVYRCTAAAAVEYVTRLIFVDTGNTVCGRHPIGVIMSAIENVRQDRQDASQGDGHFEFVRYERSSEVKKVSESSVSYASAFAVV